jgi:hypothetical protein
MLKLFDADYTITSYQAHLSRMLGLVEPLERAVKGAAGRSIDLCKHAHGFDDTFAATAA